MDTQEKKEVIEDSEIIFEGCQELDENKNKIENKKLNEEAKEKLESEEDLPDLEYGITDKNAKIDEELLEKRKKEIEIFRSGTNEEICELLKQKDKEREDGFKLLLESSPIVKDIIMNQIRLNDDILEELNSYPNEGINEDKKFKEIIDRYSS